MIPFSSSSTKSPSQIPMTQDIVTLALTRIWPSRLASRWKSTQVCKTRTCIRTCEGCGQTDSQVGLQVTKSRKFHAYHWLIRFYSNRLLAINLCWLTLGGQTKRKLNASPKLASTCESLWPGLYKNLSIITKWVCSIAESNRLHLLPAS